MRAPEDILEEYMAKKWGDQWHHSEVGIDGAIAVAREYALAVVDEIINGDYVTAVHASEAYVEWNDVKREELIRQIDNQ